jgi:sodium/potassium/calcium exchanger 6
MWPRPGAGAASGLPVTAACLPLPCPSCAWLQVTFPLLLPAYLGQRLTIPFASSSGYSREWLIVALLCCPLSLVTYLGLMTTLRAVLVTCAVGIVGAVAGAVLTAWDAPGQMAVQGLGGRAAAVVPGVLAVLAFFSGVAWIDTVATEVVAVLTFLAGLAALPAGVVGLTLLAWGSSLGDFFGNRAMARAGHTSTAITACFAAPLFNMLISLAAGFSSYLHKLGASSVAVTLTPEVALGCVFLVGYNVAIIAVGHACGQRLPPWFRHFARAWYGLYFAAAVTSGFYHRSA